MKPRTATASWNGALKDGRGTVELGSGAFKGPYSFSSRFEDGKGTQPEELVAAAHAGCFSMALAHAIGEAGKSPKNVSTTATVHLEKSGDGFAIPKIELRCEAEVPDLGDDEFQKLADEAKRTCPVSKLLQGADISLEARKTA